MKMAGYNDICVWFEWAKIKKFTHLFIVRHKKNYDFPIIVSPKDEALDIYNELCRDLQLDILDVYSLKMGFIEQFREYHCFNF